MRCPKWCLHVVPLALVAGFAVPSVALAQGIPAAHVPLSTTLGDIAKVRNGYVEAWNAKDVKTVNSMYTPDAVVLDVDGTEVVGLSAIAKKNEEGASNWPHAVIASHSVKVYGSTAVDVGTWTVHPADGGEMVYRYLAVVRHGVHGWKLQNIAVAPIPK
ncbi:MAG: YybH family protein [Gemmatimonadales bacterium]